jgi:hypothetical protein
MCLAAMTLAMGAGEAAAFDNNDLGNAPSGEVVTIRNTFASKVVDNGGLTAPADGVYLNGSSVEGATSQDWELRPAGSSDGRDWFFLVSRNTGNCLDVEGAGTANGTRVLTWPCNPDADNQKWAFNPEAGHKAILGKHSGKWLTPGSAVGNTYPLVIYSTLDDRQYWDLPRTNYRFASNRINDVDWRDADYTYDPTVYECRDGYQFKSVRYERDRNVFTYEPVEDDSLGEIHDRDIEGEVLTAGANFENGTVGGHLPGGKYLPGQWVTRAKIAYRNTAPSPRDGQIWFTCEP